MFGFDITGLVQTIGYIGVLLIIFVETGLFVGFFLPGDSLMFISGMICSTKPELLNVNIFVLIISLISAAVLGNIAGYWFGKRVGPGLFKRDDSLIFKKRYVEITNSFYKRHGGKTLILGRFLPIIRTFAPILAGVIQIPFGKFMLYNIIGASAWVTSLALAGFYLGQFEFVRNNIGYIVIGLIIVTMIPVVRTYLRERKLGKLKQD